MGYVVAESDWSVGGDGTALRPERSRQEFAPEEVQRIRALAQALGSVEQELTLPQVIALLAIASRPGLSVNDLADAMGMPQQTASRHVASLVGRHHHVSKKLGFLSFELEYSFRRHLVVQEVNQADPRRRALYLSTLGRQVVDKLLSDLRDALCTSQAAGLPGPAGGDAGASA